MAGYLGLPREQMHVVYPGINLKGHGGPRELRDRAAVHGRLLRPHLPGEGVPPPGRGVLALLRQTPGPPACRLRVSGWLGENNRPYLRRAVRKLPTAGLAGGLRARRVPDARGQGAVPAVARRAVGADDVPRAEGAVRPGGAGQRRARGAAAARVVPGTDRGDRRRAAGRAGRPAALAAGLAPAAGGRSAARRGWAEDGRKAVQARFTAERMARETAAVLAQYHHRHTPAPAEAVPS